MLFDDFFRIATSHRATDGLVPFDYQRRLACGERSEGSDGAKWLSGGVNGRSLLINVPTGCGKTAAVVLAWLWNRVALQRADWPRRLVYCLPTRVLVEQTRDNVSRWLCALTEADLGVNQAAVNTLAWLAENSPVVLMGGEDEDDWDLHPEREAILIGTQDMLLSRALNRGYAASRARWPIHFGLFNTDCLWVFDEVQLMGSGLATTTQLEAFRWLLGSKAGHRCRSIWMSATLRRDWLKTVDLRDRVDGLEELALTDDDFQSKDLENRWKALKPLTRARTPMGDAPSLASEILRTHKPGTRTIVVVNTVRRACDLFEALRTQADTGKVKGMGRKVGKAAPLALQDAPTDWTSKPALVLLHSRFRPDDRTNGIAAALADPPAAGTIVVSTQVIEAGVDVSATTLFTELAPWASLVQRFGRCNRRGEANDHAAVHWIDLPAEEVGAKVVAPYEVGDLQGSASQLRKLEDVGRGSLPDIELRFKRTHVIRRKDVIDLFDTTPDLAGNDIDIDRFIRDVEETDVRVFWRDWPQPNGEETPPEDESAPRRRELCPAPVGEFREFAQSDKRKGKAWRWNFLDGKWDRVEPKKIVPGQVFLIQAEAGGYRPERGWEATADHRVNPILPEGSESGPADDTDADSASQIGVWQTIAEHTDEVSRELDAMMNELRDDDAHTQALRVAGRWHDRGKAHDVFQDAIDDGQEVQRKKKTVRRRQRPDAWRGCRVIAKAPTKKVRAGTVVDRGFWQNYERKHFRHELASALAVLNPRNRQIPDNLRDLIAYVVAAHHGKVRLSLRSLPDEKRPRDSDGHLQPSKRFARGIWDGDELPTTDLGGGVIAPVATLSLEPMELGLCEHDPFTDQPSWAERMIRLRGSFGPFTLAYLETLLRAADMRASRAADRSAAASAEVKEDRNV